MTPDGGDGAGAEEAAPTSVAWGILGAGRVSHDFVQALKSVPGARVVAVGASAQDKVDGVGVGVWVFWIGLG